MSRAVPVLPENIPRAHVPGTGTEREPYRPGAAGRAGAAILLVDDIPDNLVALGEVVAPLAARHDLRVLTATRADEALRYALTEGDQLAVLVLDVLMPGTDGPELARLIRARRRTEHVPVIFVTALDADRRRLTEAYQSGAVDYLTKPLDPDLIRAKVAAFVELHRRRADARARERRRFADEARALSAQARAESAVTRARLAAVLDSLPDAVSAFDDEWRFLYTNPTAAALLLAAGHDPDAVLGQILWDVAPDLRGTRFETEFRRAQADGRVVAFDAHYASTDQWLENRAVPGPDGTLTVFSRDVTAQRQAEVALRESEARLAGLLVEAAAARAEAEVARGAAEEARAVAERARSAAEEASQAKSRFLANMSHELRTPLNAIVGHVALVEDGIYGLVTDGQRSALGRVRRAQRHLLTLINDVLDLAKLEARHVEYVLTPVRLADVLGDAAAMLEPQAAEQRLTFAVLPPERDLLVWADREKLRQVVLNLLSNAVKFTPAGGQIVVDVATPDDAREVVQLRVRDTGIGIAADQLERVFRPFVQIDGGKSTYTRVSKGTGLGLTISRDLARGMGGELVAESTPGAGSTFTVVLRRAILATGERTERRSRDERRADGERRSGEERRSDP